MSVVKVRDVKILRRILRSYRMFGCRNFAQFAFLSTPLLPIGERRHNVRCSSWAHWKRVVDFPISVKLFLLGVTCSWGATSEKIVDCASEIGADWVIASQDCFGHLCNSVTSKYHSLHIFLSEKIDRKSAISLESDQFDPKFQVEGVDPHQLFLHD